MTGVRTRTLAGIECHACGIRSFPAGALCRVCASNDTAPVDLGSRGTVETWSGDDRTTVIEVRLASGVLVMGRLLGGEPRIGQEVRSIETNAGVGFLLA